MNVALPSSLNVDEFLAWAERQEEGKYELVDGVVIMQQSQQWGHSKVKLAVAVRSARSRHAAGLPTIVASDGPTVRISKRKAFVPDALVAPLPEPGATASKYPTPSSSSRCCRRRRRAWMRRPSCAATSRSRACSTT